MAKPWILENSSPGLPSIGGEGFLSLSRPGTNGRPSPPPQFRPFPGWGVARLGAHGLHLWFFGCKLERLAVGHTPDRPTLGASAAGVSPELRRARKRSKSPVIIPGAGEGAC